MATEQQCFVYLNALRKSGETNMYGAAPYLQRDMGLNRTEAKEMLLKWMRSFSSSSNVNNHCEDL